MFVAVFFLFSRRAIPSIFSDSVLLVLVHFGHIRFLYGLTLVNVNMSCPSKVVGEYIVVFPVDDSQRAGMTVQGGMGTICVFKGQLSLSPQYDALADALAYIRCLV